MATKYQKFGLRADKNLVDLESSNKALGNLLEGLTADPSFPFTVSDLVVINGLRNTEVTSDDLVQVGADETRITYSPSDNPGAVLDVQPQVRIIDRIENYRVVTGSPNFISGGDGPNSWIVPSNRMGTGITSTSTGADVVPNRDAEDVIGPVDFWDNGIWVLGSKLDATFRDTYGAVQWEGYTSLTDFTIKSTGLYMIEYDPYDNGNWVKAQNIYAEDRPVAYISSSVVDGVTQITIDDDQLPFINVGDFIPQGVDKASVDSIDITVSPVVVKFDSEVTGLSATGGTLTLSFEMGTENEITSRLIRLRRTYTGDKFKMRITVWWPSRGDGDTLQNKTFEFYDDDSERYPYIHFYKEYDRTATPVLYTYEHFEKNKASPTKQDSDVALSTSETLAIEYTPPINVNNKLNITDRVGTYDGLGKILCDISDIKVGDWLVFKVSGVPQRTTQVKQIQSARSGDDDSAIYIDYDFHPYSVGYELTFDVVDTIGLIGIYKIGATSGTGGYTVGVTVLDGSTSNAEIKVDYLCADQSHTNFKRIVDRPTNGQVVVENIVGYSSETFTVNNYLLVYASSGLKDMSSEAQCAGVIGKELGVDTSNGGNTITLLDNQGLVEGMYVQFLTGTSVPNRIASNTQIASGGINGNTITLTNNIVGQLTRGATIVFIDETVYGTLASDDKNREYCILPLNTAPPFSGTDEGLKTPDSYPNIKFNGAEFRNLYLNNTVSADNSDDSYSEYLTISHNGVNYKALIK